ncbi:MAG: AAA family ATPase [Armatimonadetes bacterium]|nr:AAA family ATPase [Armatimonadota bacterium]
MRSCYIDFINHGILPFVGRDAARRTLLARWGTIATTPSLQLSIVSGELGAGKSRFVEEIEPAIVQAGGLVIHAKLYPESTNSIAPLLARAVRFLTLRRGLIIDDPTETVRGVAETIRRLTQTRPVLLLIEDIHLLSGETTREFAELLERLSAAPMLVLATARPLSPPLRATVDLYLSDDIELPRLTFQEIQLIWAKLFNTRLADDAAKLIEETTGGNPLAIRAILRGSLKSGEIAPSHIPQQWELNIPLPTFDHSLRRQMMTLLDGMSAHLSPAERSAAEMVAGLGEIFSVETARLLLQNADTMLDQLVFKGVLVSVGHSPTVLPQTTTTFSALSFTHTLLHHRFIQHPAISEHQLVMLICSDAPLCTVLPFRLLSTVAVNFAIPLSEIRTAMTRSIKLARALDRTSDWQWALPVWDAAAALWRKHYDRWNAHERLSLELELLMNKMALLRRNEQGEDYRVGVERLIELTSSQQLPEDMLRYRLLTVIYQDIYRSRLEPRNSLEVRKKVEELLQHHPQLRHTNGYLFYLSHLAHTYSNSTSVMQEVEQAAEELLLDQTAPEEFRQELQLQVLPTFLLGFSTQQQVERRIVFLSKYEELCRTENRFVDRIRSVIFYTEIGYFEKAEIIAEELRPNLINRGLIRSSVNCQLHQICFHLLKTKQWKEIASKLESLFLDVPADYHTGLQRHAALLVMNFGILLNRPDVALQQLRWLHTPENLPLYLRIFIGLSSKSLQQLCQSRPKNIPLAESSLWQLLQLVADENSPDIERIHELSASLLNAELLRIYNVSERCIIIDLLSDAHNRGILPPVSHYLQAEIDSSIHQALCWLQERELLDMAKGTLKYIQRHIGQHVQSQWEWLLKNNSTEIAENRGEHIEVVVIGEIAVGNNPNAITPVRGQRARTLIGLMVANQLMDQPMTMIEFSYIIAGNEHLHDVDRSRKLLNSTVFRLRDAIGHHVILTDQEVPRLNLEYVTIDLLEATRLLRQSDTALRQGTLPAAHHFLISALDKFGKSMIFPELYDTFFEALRDDIENERRDLILRVSQSLLNEGDPHNAEEILQRGFHAMPDDEEVATLLCNTLIQNGKRVQAQRVQIKLREIMANN